MCSHQKYLDLVCLLRKAVRDDEAGSFFFFLFPCEISSHKSEAQNAILHFQETGSSSFMSTWPRTKNNTLRSFESHLL